MYKELSIDDKFFPVKSAINQMSRWKDQLVSPEEALRTPARDTKGALAAKVYAAYEKKLKDAGAFDFDDLIYQTVQLLAGHEEVRQFYQNKYRYLLVDEYQDTSVHSSAWSACSPGRKRTSASSATMTRASTGSAVPPSRTSSTSSASIPAQRPFVWSRTTARPPISSRRQLRHPAQHRAQGQDPLDEER